MLDSIVHLAQPIIGLMLVVGMVCTIAWPLCLAALVGFAAWATYSWRLRWKLAGWVPLASYGYALHRAFAYDGHSNLAAPAIVTIWVAAMIPYCVLFAISWRREKSAARSAPRET